MRSCSMSGNMETSCGCVSDMTYMRREYVPAMAYVPWQNFTTVYEPDKALEVGTIFPELDKPFYGCRRMGR